MRALGLGHVCHIVEILLAFYEMRVGTKSYIKLAASQTKDPHTHTPPVTAATVMYTTHVLGEHDNKHTTHPDDAECK